MLIQERGSTLVNSFFDNHILKSVWCHNDKNRCYTVKIIAARNSPLFIAPWKGCCTCGCKWKRQVSYVDLARSIIWYAYFLALTNQYTMQAKKLIGATLLVVDEDRPELEEGEFYTHDLIGMKVFMKVCSNPQSCVYMKTNTFSCPYSLFKILLKHHLLIKQNYLSYIPQMFFCYIFEFCINLVILTSVLL